MKYFNNSYTIKLVSLNKDKCVFSPRTKDIFNYTVLDKRNAVIKYKLIIYDDYSDEIGVFQMDYYILCNRDLKYTDIEYHVNKIAVMGREAINKESMRFKIKMYIPNAETIFIHGNLDAA